MTSSISSLVTKNYVIERVKRRLGYPMVKVELDDQQIKDHIDYAHKKFVKWAVGQSTQEVWFTQLLSGGQYIYDMPVGVTSIVDYHFDALGGGINTLFTIDNYLYMQGMYDVLLKTGGDSYSMISYHIARDFLDTVRKYTPAEYNYKYHWTTNQLEVQPPPKCDNTMLITDSNDCNDNDTTVSVTSPGFLLIRAQMIEGSTLTGYPPDVNENHFWSLDWILDYVTAHSKVTLGHIRRKFSNFQSIGNQGVSLDGDSLVSEGKEEIERLEENLRKEEAFEGYGVYLM